MSRYACPALCFGVLMLLVMGCGRKTESTAPERVGPPAASSNMALGSEQAAGPFQVTLSATSSTPRVGKVQFTVIVVDKGQPIGNATVKLNLEMPGMAGPSVVLTPMDDHYMGSTDVSMAGEWKAKVEVAAAGESGTAEYAFTVTQ